MDQYLASILVKRFYFYEQPLPTALCENQTVDKQKNYIL
jgi:hypothetical protein